MGRYNLSDSDIDIVNTVLIELDKRGVLSDENIFQMCNNESQFKRIIKAILESGGASKSTHVGFYKPNDLTKGIVDSDFMRKALEEAKKTADTNASIEEKFRLEIAGMKRDRWMSYVSIVVSLLALLGSMYSIYLQCK